MNKGEIDYYAKILAFAGSARQDSFNKKLVKIAVEGFKAADATYLISVICPYRSMMWI